jgi:hypothetical protein
VIEELDAEGADRSIRSNITSPDGSGWRIQRADNFSPNSAPLSNVFSFPSKIAREQPDILGQFSGAKKCLCNSSRSAPSSAFTMVLALNGAAVAKACKNCGKTLPHRNRAAGSLGSLVSTNAY